MRCANGSDEMQMSQHMRFWDLPYHILSYDATSGSEITPCNKIDKPLVVYRFSGSIMTSIITLCAL